MHLPSPQVTLVLLIQRPHFGNLCFWFGEGKQPSFVISPTQILVTSFSHETQLSWNTHLICCVHDMNKRQALCSTCSRSRGGSRRQNTMWNEPLYRNQRRRERQLTWGQRMSGVFTRKENLGRKWGMWGTRAQQVWLVPSHVLFLFSSTQFLTALLGPDCPALREAR